MSSKDKRFVDDGWAIWIEGDDVSTVYINDWINPKGKSFVDLAVRIRGIDKSKNLNIYVPFLLEEKEIEDLSQHLKDENIFRVTFSSVGIVDYKKNEYTSEAAYNGKTIDIIHLPISEWEIKKMSKGTLLKCDIEKIRKFIDNEEAYFFLRFPHKSLNQILKPRRDVTTFITRLRDLITSPVVSENYVYQIRINEARMLPIEINKIGAFHRQKLNKAVVTMAITEDYEVNDHSCYRIRRIEEDLYKEFVPKDFKLDDVINYLWQEDRGNNYQGRYNFYLHISRNKIGKASMFFYLLILILVGLLGEFLWNLIDTTFNIFG